MIRKLCDRCREIGGEDYALEKLKAEICLEGLSPRSEAERIIRDCTTATGVIEIPSLWREISRVITERNRFAGLSVRFVHADGTIER
jgi:hypothetical protein